MSLTSSKDCKTEEGNPSNGMDPMMEESVAPVVCLIQTCEVCVECLILRQGVLQYLNPRRSML